MLDSYKLNDKFVDAINMSWLPALDIDALLF